MRTRKEIEMSANTWQTETEKCILEVLLDIRDIQLSQHWHPYKQDILNDVVKRVKVI